MNGLSRLFRTRCAKREDAEQWIGIADMMSGLMMVFLFMAVAYMYYVQVDRENIKEIAVTYKDTQVANGVILLSGRVTSGGSYVNWHSKVEAESVVLLPDFPRAAAEKQIEEQSDDDTHAFSVQDDQVNAEALRVERERLLARLKQIDELLA